MPNPAAMLPALLRRMAGAGSPGAPLSPSAPPDLGKMVASEYSQLQNVDPGKLVADLKKAKETLAALFPIAVTRVPDAAKGISQAVVGISAAMKALEKAQQTLQSAGPALGISAAQMSPPMQGPPNIGGMQPPNIGGMTP